MCFASSYVPISGNQGDLTVVDWYRSSSRSLSIARCHFRAIHIGWLLAKCLAKFGLKGRFKDNSKDRRKFIPALWKNLPTNPWCCHGYKKGSCLCQYLIAKVETEILKPLIWKRYKDDIFSLWTLRRGDNAVHWASKQLDLRLKFQKQKHFWIQTFIKVKDSEAVQFLMCVRTSNLLKHFNIRTSLRATHQRSKKASSEAKHWDLSEQALLKTYLKTKFKLLNQCLQERSYPENLVQRTLSEVQFENRKLALPTVQKPKENKWILPFVI